MVPQVGQKIGPYEILGRLGSGGMGLVFTAWDSRLHRDVAIKLLRDDVLTPSTRSRFLGEARAASRLNHPNICTIFDIGEEQGCPYLVMELLKGETLRARIQHGVVPYEDILRVATDVADALAVAHEKGIVHRDIKPANIVLVDKAGGRFQTKVLDFGLAKINAMEGADTRPGLTTTGMTVGTVSYMSPEQARGQLIDGRSDIFSLGVVLYEMATGKLPFQGATSALVFVQLLNHPPEPMRNLSAGFPREFEQIINTCLQKQRDARFQSAHDLVKALNKLSSHSSAGSRQSWLSKVKTNWGRQEDTPPEPVVEIRTVEAAEAAPEAKNTEETSGPHAMVAADALLRPVKRTLGPKTGRMPLEDETPVPAGSPERGMSPSPSQSSVPTEFGSSIEVLDSAPRSSLSFPEGTPVPKIMLPQLTKADLDNPVPRFQRLEWAEEQASTLVQDEQRPPTLADEAAARKRRIFFGVLFVLVIAGSSVFIFSSKRPPAPAIMPTVLIASVTNRTGDQALDGVLSAGLELALQQSPGIALRTPFQGGNAVPLGDDDGPPGQQLARQAAKAAGANTFVVADAHADGPTYTVSLQVFRTDTDVRTAQESETAASQEQVLAAIDRLATDLRSALGEPADSIQRSAVPLNREATANLEALRAYASGEQLEASGRLFDAMYAYERAVTSEPHFVQAHLRLAGIYRWQHAEVSAATSAALAQTSAGVCSDRTRMLAQAAYAADALGDYTTALSLLSQLRSGYPSDVEVLDGIARLQLSLGKFDEAAQTAQSALALAPADRRAIAYAEQALVALDNVDGAAKMADDHDAESGTRTDVDAVLSLLNGSGADDLASASNATDDLGLQDSTAAVLDARGQFSEGLAKWRQVAARASAAPELGSAASYALAHAAFDRALAGDCTRALDLLREASSFASGPHALFQMGVAGGLCGNVQIAHNNAATLMQSYGQSFEVKRFYVSDLNALAQWKSGATADSLLGLSARQYDRLSLTPYLRGLVYLADKQPQMASVEFQSMLSHAGATALANPPALAMAQLGTARAYAATGDSGNAMQAYRKFLSLWPHAAPDSPLIIEAQSAMHPAATAELR